MKSPTPGFLARTRFDSTIAAQHEPAVFATAVATLYEHGPKVLAANALNAAVIAVVLWRSTDHRLLAGWLVAMGVMVLVRGWLGRRFERNGSAAYVQRWARRFTLGSALSGLLWGGGAALLFTRGDLPSQVLLAFTIGGMSAGASSSVASHLPAFYAFIIPAVTPLIARFAVGGDAFQWGMAAMLAVFTILVTMIGRTTHRTIVESYRLSFVNDDLVARLCDTQAELEHTNSELEVRVEERTQELEQQTAARRAAERNLYRAQKLDAVGRLTGGVAHDFNNLLTVIVSALEAAEACADPERKAEMLTHAREAAVRGGDLTRSLLAFSRREPLQVQVVDPGAVVQRITASMVRRALPQTIDLHVEIPPTPCHVVVDQAQFETAVLNLALNARDAMPKGGTLVLQLHHITIEKGADTLAPGEYVELWVADNGVGIEPALLDRVFEPFFTTKGDQGTGLGLSMVYGFAQQSGGAIRVESTLGAGTSARLLLPRVAAPQGTDDVQSATTPPRGQGETILVVEDEDAVRSLTALSVRGLGYRTLEARTAAEALALLDAHPEIALVLTDILMPGDMDGLALARELQTRRPGLPVVLASGYSEGPLQAAAFPMLRKPYRRAALAGTLRAALSVVLPEA